MTSQTRNNASGASDDCYKLGGILKRLDQFRAFVPGVVYARIDGMVNKLSHSTPARELDCHSGIA